MEEQGIYLFRRNWVYGGCHEWMVQATEAEINALKDFELQNNDVRVASVNIELLDSEVEPSHAFDSNGRLWCKMPVDIYKTD